MPDLAGFAPYVVPVVIGLLVVRLVLSLLWSLTRRGPERAAAVRRAWGQYLTGMFFAGFLLPFLSVVFRQQLNTVPIWVLLFLGGFVAVFHNGALAARAKGAAGPQPRSGAQAPAPAQPRKQKPQQKVAVPVPVGTPVRTRARPMDTPLLPDLPDLQAPAPDSAERVIGKLPMPAVRRGPSEPLPSDRAEIWYERQEARLGSALEGKTLAAARLRLSTVKSMLLLGQIGLREADDDVSTVLGRAGRG